MQYLRCRPVLQVGLLVGYGPMAAYGRVSMSDQTETLLVACRWAGGKGGTGGGLGTAQGNLATVLCRFEVRSVAMSRGVPLDQ